MGLAWKVAMVAKTVGSSCLGQDLLIWANFVQASCDVFYSRLECGTLRRPSRKCINSLIMWFVQQETLTYKIIVV